MYNLNIFTSVVIFTIILSQRWIILYLFKDIHKQYIYYYQKTNRNKYTISCKVQITQVNFLHLLCTSLEGILTVILSEMSNYFSSQLFDVVFNTKMGNHMKQRNYFMFEIPTRAGKGRCKNTIQTSHTNYMFINMQKSKTVNFRKFGKNKNVHTQTRFSS